MRLNHVGLTVSDPTRSAAFYGEHFGFTQEIVTTDDVVLLTDESGAVLALNRGVPPSAETLHTFHFGAEVPSGDDVRAARERFKAAGVAESEWQVEPDGHVRVQVFDPDGYRVEVFNN